MLCEISMPLCAAYFNTRRAQQSICAVKDFVAAMLFSSPAQQSILKSEAFHIVESFLFVIHIVRMPYSFALFKALLVSEVSPDWVMNTYKKSLSCGITDFNKNSLEYIAPASMFARLPNNSAANLAQL